MGFIYTTTTLLFFISAMVEDMYFHVSGREITHPWLNLIANVIVSAIMSWAFVNWVF